MPTLGTIKIPQIKEWTSETLTNSLIGLPSTYDGYWGVLTWDQELPDENADVKVDILKASDDSVLVSDLSWTESGIDLSIYDNVKNEDIKLRFKLFKLDNSPIVKNIQLKAKDLW